MADTCWTVICHGGGYQALTETHSLGPLRSTQLVAEGDGWASGLPPAVTYTPLTTPPLVVTAVPEPVLVHAPTRPERAPVPEPEPQPEPQPPVVAVLLSVPTPEPLPPPPKPLHELLKSATHHASKPLPPVLKPRVPKPAPKPPTRKGR